MQRGRRWEMRVVVVVGGVRQVAEQGKRAGKCKGLQACA